MCHTYQLLHCQDINTALCLCFLVDDEEMKCLRLLRDLSVVMKLGAALLDLVIVGVCCVWGLGAIPPYNSPAGAVLFIHALAGCLFALPTLLLAQTLGNLYS